MRENYRKWLEDQKYSDATVNAQIHRVSKVEAAYGDLDDHFEAGTLQSIIDSLQYSSDDERRSLPNPSKLGFEGNIRNNLQSYKNAVVRYRKFLAGWERGQFASSDEENTREEVAVEIAEQVISQKLSLERDMQAAIRQNIQSLDKNLRIIDDGAERSVLSGFIDVTCDNEVDGSLVVVELKAGKADSRAIGQILGYMGDLAEEEPDRTVRGILVAHEFDKRSRSAARVVPTLKLVKYTINFQFSEEK
ncbi:endonuclease NucS domain-containing protein [Hoeflea sp. BAL378]|uniref:endonuclease NucS domain-containing protein n=1 Tax=Hoeflea sp. BAL378 TaxID=1547437 RepID=UPI0009E010F8|nr:endonuclease NucS domain-containing protein [Hoeflea sp. BAL378]